MSEDLSKLNLVELLDLLEPVPEPTPVSLWPQTVGWVWLGLAVLVAVAWLLYRWHRWHRANAYRREALKALALAGSDPGAVAEILRRAALSAFPRREIAGLTGEAWLAFLDRSYGGSGFSEGPGRLLAVAPYAGSGAGTASTAGLAPLAAEWVRRHRRPAKAAS